jgi:hypothetical protein
MKIPQIGCIYLSSGHKATGEFSGHNVEITVGADGIEKFRVDGMLVEPKIGANRTVSGTNLPSVHLWGGSTGFSFCSDPAASSCPSSISVHSRNPDKTILFSVTQCLPPDYQRCVGNQANWDYELSRLSQPNPQLTRPVNGQTPLPTGPFSLWPDEIKKRAIASLSFRCGFISVMQLDNYQGPKEAGKEMVQALASACIDHQMPADWPGHAEMRETSKQHYSAAQGLDPSLPDPVAMMSHLPAR